MRIIKYTKSKLNYKNSPEHISKGAIAFSNDNNTSFIVFYDEFSTDSLAFPYKIVLNTAFIKDKLVEDDFDLFIKQYVETNMINTNKWFLNINIDKFINDNLNLPEEATLTTSVMDPIDWDKNHDSYTKYIKHLEETTHDIIVEVEL